MLQGATLDDVGDLDIGNDPSATHDALTEVLARHFARTFPIVLGGDATITHAIVRGIARERISVVRIGRSHRLGDVAGGIDPDNVMSFVGRLEHVDRIVQIGVRGIAQFGHSAREQASTWFGADRVEDLGTSRIIESMPLEVPIYVSLDLGAFDRCLPVRTVRDLLAALGSHRQVIGADVNEVRTDADADLALELAVLLADARHWRKS